MVDVSANKLEGKIVEEKTKEVDPGGEDHDIEVKEFTPATGFSTDEAAALLKEWGRNELEEKTTPSWLIYLRMVRGRRRPTPRRRRRRRRVGDVTTKS